MNLNTKIYLKFSTSFVLLFSCANSTENPKNVFWLSGVFIPTHHSLNNLQIRGDKMLKTGIKKYDLFRTHYWHNATKVGKYRLPLLKPTQFIPNNVLSFNERKKFKDNDNRWMDFFIDDTLFECFWNTPDRYLNILRKPAGIITTDFSMYPELLPGQNIWNCTRNRIMAYYLQEKGFNIIPVASASCEDDFDWCFDGLPQQSSIAVSTNGCKSSLYGMNMFVKTVCAIEKRLNPYCIIVCGIPNKNIREKLSNFSNISFYKSFSQRIGVDGNG